MINQMKFQIYVDDKSLYQYIYSMMDTTRYVINRAIVLSWEWNNYSWEYKKKEGVFPKPSDSFINNKNGSGYSLKGAINNQINQEVYELQSDSKDMALDKGLQLFNNSKKDIAFGKKTIPCFKQKRIFLKNRSIKVYRDKLKYYLDVGIFSKKFKTEKELKSGRILFNLKVCDSRQRKIVNKILSGEYKIAGSSISYNERKKKFFINLAYDFKAKKMNRNFENVLGVDLGLKYVAYMAVSNSKSSTYINGGEIEAFRMKTLKLQKSLRNQSKVACKGNRGHGRKKRTQNQLIIGNKIANFKDLKNHEYAKYIVKYAIDNNCYLIQLEDLKNISKQHSFLANWSYYDLQNKIIMKAEKEGIQVKFINPQYTSQMCNECGYIDKDNRVIQEIFECCSCGHKTNADLNAARNISILDIDKKIKEKMN